MRKYSPDVKHYSRTLDKLIRVYQIVYGLNQNEFIARFWNSEIIDDLGAYTMDYTLTNKILKVDTLALSDQNKAIQKLAICLGWTCQKTCRYFMREIMRELYYEIAAIDKWQDYNGRWHKKGRQPVFIHPMYDKIHQPK